MISNPVLLPKVRSDLLMASAQAQPCCLRLPGICNHDRSTTVMAHLPGIGKSMGSKVSDIHGSFACAACHSAIDNFGWEKRGLTAAIVLDAMLRGHAETQARWVGMGLLAVPGMTVV
ncbi:MAG: nuclease domain-containing protein [Paracoccaceae bacterium]